MAVAIRALVHACSHTRVTVHIGFRKSQFVMQAGYMFTGSNKDMAFYKDWKTVRELPHCTELHKDARLPI
jgi:hypothetical protein